MFQPGEKVCHIAGGPVMAVASIDGDNVICSWMDKGKACTDSFPAVVLKRWEPPRAFAPPTDTYF